MKYKINFPSMYHEERGFGCPHYSYQEKTYVPVVSSKIFWVTTSAKQRLSPWEPKITWFLSMAAIEDHILSMFIMMRSWEYSTMQKLSDSIKRGINLQSFTYPFCFLLYIFSSVSMRSKWNKFYFFLNIMVTQMNS